MLLQCNLASCCIFFKADKSYDWYTGYSFKMFATINYNITVTL